MADYIPPALDWVHEQVELYESSGRTQGTTLLDTGMPCILVTHTGNKTGGSLYFYHHLAYSVSTGQTLIGRANFR